MQPARGLRRLRGMEIAETDLYVLANRRRSRLHARWAVALFLLVGVVIAVVVMVGPASGAAGGCGGG